MPVEATGERDIGGSWAVVGRLDEWMDILLEQGVVMQGLGSL